MLKYVQIVFADKDKLLVVEHRVRQLDGIRQPALGVRLQLRPVQLTRRLPDVLRQLRAVHRRRLQLFGRSVLDTH